MSQTSVMKSVGSSFRRPIDGAIVNISARFGDKSREVERFLRFALVGIIGAIIDSGTLFLLQATILPPTLQEPIDYNVAIAQTIAFVAAILSNFTWNRLWTYPDSRSRSMRRQLALFVFISLIGWVGRTIWITTAHQAVGQFMMPILLPEIQIFRPGYVPSAVAISKLGTMVTWLVGVIVVMIWNFIANRLWTYNDVE
jgi:putative flippase GtrA